VGDEPTYQSGDKNDGDVDNGVESCHNPANPCPRF
jgi:hypothetical protein